MATGRNTGGQLWSGPLGWRPKQGRLLRSPIWPLTAQKGRLRPHESVAEPSSRGKSRRAERDPSPGFTPSLAARASGVWAAGWRDGG